MNGIVNNAASVSVMGNYTTGAQQAEDVPRISRLTSAVHKALQTNMEIAAMLEQRLHNVLSPTGPQQGGSEANVPRPVTSPLASDLETFEAQLYALSARYTDILNRLET